MSKAPQPKFAIIVQLWRTSAPLEEFVAFEKRALKLIREHGGVLQNITRPIPTGDGLLPDEIHVIEFPSRESFGVYVADPQKTELDTARAAVIEKTVVWEGVSVEDYQS